MADLKALAQAPETSDIEIDYLLENIKDWQFQNGSLLKAVEKRGLAHPIASSLFPSKWPRSLFERAQRLQILFNKLYARVSEDEEWLRGALGNVLQQETSMAKILFDIYDTVKDEGFVQEMSLGIFRSDYMLCLNNVGREVQPSQVDMKQIEFNTYSCAGGAHSERISNMHKYLQKIGAYSDPLYATSTFPANVTVQSLVAGLSEAHRVYDSSKRSSSMQTGILMVVQPHNINICDERPIEQLLWTQGIPCYRVVYGESALELITVAENRELLFRHPISHSEVEISVVYHRAGYDIEEYDDAGTELRYQLERSMAIKCPSISGHLATLKIVQQQLAVSGNLERFLSPDEAAEVMATFAPIYPMDDSQLGQTGKSLVMKPPDRKSFVLKPCLEGGSHNYYGEEISAFLNSTPSSRWKEFILMEMIKPPLVRNYLSLSDGPYFGPVISELGVFGTVLWKRSGVKTDVLSNQQASCSFKTKPAEINEMSVVKGYGAFDSPLLI